jgi:coenzyme F420 hydrogenase subunit beta
MTRASDEKTRSAAQHGGTVSALVKLALEEGLIDKALLSERREDHLPHSRTIDRACAVMSAAGSSFVVSPTLATFNRVSREATGNIGVVATPCQALALAKMRVNTWPEDAERIQKLSLVIGLFCGWALSWDKLGRLLAGESKGRTIKGMDIPPSGHACMEIYVDDGTIEVPMDKVNACVREACNYCFDMTCEFSDLAVGSARSPEGWAVDRGWNQVIVRSELGQSLLDLAKQKRVLDFKDVPAANLDKLKAASAKKKQACLGNLTDRTGTEKDLIYLDCEDAAVCRIREI